MPKACNGLTIFSPSNSEESKEGENASPEKRVNACLYFFFSLCSKVLKYAAPALGYSP